MLFTQRNVYFLSMDLVVFFSILNLEKIFRMNANILKMKKNPTPCIFIDDFAIKLAANWFCKEKVKVAKGTE